MDDTSGSNITYYREKAMQFQSLLNQVDQASFVVVSLLNSGIDLGDELKTELENALAEYQDKQASFRTTAEAVNAGAAVVNSLGGSFPLLDVPKTLGLSPIVLPAAAVAALNVTANLIDWGHSWIKQIYDKVNSIDTAKLDDDSKSKIIEAEQALNSALTVSNNSPLPAMARLVKYGGLILAGWIAYRFYTKGN